MNKITIVVGHKTQKPENWEKMSINERFNSNWSVDSFHRLGFWKKESIVNLAKKMGFIGEINVSHTRMSILRYGKPVISNHRQLKLLKKQHFDCWAKSTGKS